MIRTWMIEHVFVLNVLLVVFFLTGRRPVEAIGAAAVLLSFGHATVSDRLVEKQAAKASPDVYCYRWSARYFVAKELAWLAYFSLTGSYAALVGVVVFLLYPVWRRLYRIYWPATGSEVR